MCPENPSPDRSNPVLPSSAFWIPVRLQAVSWFFFFFFASTPLPFLACTCQVSLSIHPRYHRLCAFPLCCHQQPARTSRPSRARPNFTRRPWPPTPPPPSPELSQATPGNFTTIVELLTDALLALPVVCLSLNRPFKATACLQTLNALYLGGVFDLPKPALHPLLLFAISLPATP